MIRTGIYIFISVLIGWYLSLLIFGKKTLYSSVAKNFTCIQCDYPEGFPSDTLVLIFLKKEKDSILLSKIDELVLKDFKSKIDSEFNQRFDLIANVSYDQYLAFGNRNEILNYAIYTENSWYILSHVEEYIYGGEYLESWRTTYLWMFFGWYEFNMKHNTGIS